jgi:hypothetical protein
MTDLVTLALGLSIGALILKPSWPERRFVLPLATLLLISTLVQLTRARWIGLALGTIFVLVWLFAYGEPGRTASVRRRIAGAAFALVGLALLLTLVLPGLTSGGAIGERLGSVVEDLQSGGGTVGVRLVFVHELLRYLGGQWLTGLGFIPPYSRFFFGLPFGSIRNPDVGVLNAVMTMGVIGALLIYVPVAATLVDCLKRLRVVDPDRAWLVAGGAIWIIATMVSSVTLITLFSTSGLALTAVAIIVLLQCRAPR